MKQQQKDWRAQAMGQAMKWMQDPRVMKFMADPRVMRVAMQAVAAPGRAKAEWHKRRTQLAKTLGFATRSQLRELEADVRKLQNTVNALREKGTP